jgi:ribonuclease D
MKASMKPPKLIAAQDEFDWFIEQISEAKHLAVDSESNSYFAYRPRICLIQISANNKDFILDPLTLKDLTGLGRILSDPSVEKIIHAAENDLIGFKRDYRFPVINIFDTSIACRLLGRKRLGLARILSENFGITMDKKYQRCNWEKRPLNPEQLYYAQQDTRFLLELRDRLHRQLVERNLWQQAKKEFARLERIRVKPPRDWDPDGYLRLRGVEKLSRTSLGVLKELFSYREYLARKTNKAPFRIMNNEVMVRLAGEAPDNKHDLLRIKGLPSRFRGKGAAHLLRVINRGKSVH